ncbi:peptide chain release factor 1 [Candidatus Peribacteria bacterium]|nr:MAG: peptide chain release factor 1 [Candidatus Peribacteria bacterium]
MIEQLKTLAQEYDSLQASLQQEAVYNDPAKVASISKKLASLETAHRLYEEYRKCEQSLKDTTEMKQDPEMHSLAVEEETQITKKLKELEAEIQVALVPKNEIDERNAILEIRAGTGGEEASLFAAELMRMYLRFAETQGWTTELIDKSDTDGGGVKEVIMKIGGADVYGHLKFEAGVHRVQRIPATENKGRVHTSAASVAVLPEAEETDIVIRAEDLRIDTYRSGGAGGQHVNKTDSAVRITHIPTGVVVSSQNERSQIKNRAYCMNVLRTRLFAAQEEKRASELGNLRSSQIGTGDRGEKIRTYNFPQDRLTDHRINQSFHNLPGIMEGDIGEIINALRAYETEMLMKGAQE